MKVVSFRIVIPTKVGDLLYLANLIYKKHLADGSNSPLHALSDFTWEEHGPKIEEALVKHREAEEHIRKAEQAYRERDRLLENLDGLIKATRDLLKGIFRLTPKKLGEWGFEVNDTPRVSKQK